MDTLSYILDWIHGFTYLMIIPTICLTLWCITDRLTTSKRKSHHDSYPGSFWYNSHKNKDNYR